MAFWINIYGYQPYPRHGPLSVNQLKNDSYRQALYIVIGTAAWNMPERNLNGYNFTFILLCLMKIHLLHNCQNHNFFLFPILSFFLFNFFYEILQSIEGKKCQVPRCFVKYFFAPHSWPLLHFHIAHGGLLTFSSVLSCVGTVDCTIFKTCRFIETAKILIRY